ncbi:MAG: relaxase/mobilization nuclease domain-containing protein [Bacteroidota bacterium]
MILEASTLHSVQHARVFAQHLYKSENERIEVWESLSGSQQAADFTADLVDLQLLTNLTHGRTGIFHVAIAPRQYEIMTADQWQRSMSAIAKEFELDEQMRLVMFHQKAGRKHLHVMWSLVDESAGTLKQVGRYKRRLQRVATQLEQEFGHELTPRWAGERSIQISHAERITKIKTGKDPKARKEHLRQLWEQYQQPEQFLTVTQQQGYIIAQGERCRYALVERDGTVHNLVRQLPTMVKLRQVEQRLQLHYHELPSIAEAKQKLRLDQEKVHLKKQQQLQRIRSRIQDNRERKR